MNLNCQKISTGIVALQAAAFLSHAAPIKFEPNIESLKQYYNHVRLVRGEAK
jgi:hypothetical protein